MPFKFNALTGKFDLVKSGYKDDEKIYLNTNKDTYLVYNSSRTRLELWVNGTIRKAWG